jgi:hypothetical protein
MQAFCPIRGRTPSGISHNRIIHKKRPLRNREIGKVRYYSWPISNANEVGFIAMIGEAVNS